MMDFNYLDETDFKLFERLWPDKYLYILTVDRSAHR